MCCWCLGSGEEGQGQKMKGNGATRESFEHLVHVMTGCRVGNAWSFPSDYRERRADACQHASPVVVMTIYKCTLLSDDLQIKHHLSERSLFRELGRFPLYPRNST